MLLDIIHVVEHSSCSRGECVRSLRWRVFWRHILERVFAERVFFMYEVEEEHVKKIFSLIFLVVLYRGLTVVEEVRSFSFFSIQFLLIDDALGAGYLLHARRNKSDIHIFGLCP